MSEPRSTGVKVVALVLSGGGVALILCIVGVTMISAPKFMRFQDRSRQSECKVHLRALVTAERALYEERERYSSKPAELGFAFEVEKGNHYQYRLGLADDEVVPTADATVAVLDAALPPELKAKLGVKGTCPSCEVTVACVGNVDSDDTLDVWSVTLGFKKQVDGFSSVPGQPFNHVDDTQQ